MDSITVDIHICILIIKSKAFSIVLIELIPPSFQIKKRRMTILIWTSITRVRHSSYFYANIQTWQPVRFTRTWPVICPRPVISFGYRTFSIIKGKCFTFRLFKIFSDSSTYSIYYTILVCFKIKYSITSCRICNFIKQPELNHFRIGITVSIASIYITKYLYRGKRCVVIILSIIIPPMIPTKSI